MANEPESRLRIDGTLSKWHDDRGFGFITPTQGGPEVFVHISAFPRDGRRPTVGEPVTFEIEIDAKGKKRARDVRCPRRSVARHEHRRSAGRRAEKPGLFGRLVPGVVVVAVLVFGYGQYSRRASVSPEVADPPAAAEPSAKVISPAAFHCDGRTYCSQMTSCAEATFFLRNCPGVKMDGDHDGIPCEQQWCSGPS